MKRIFTSVDKAAVIPLHSFLNPRHWCYRKLLSSTAEFFGILYTIHWFRYNSLENCSTIRIVELIYRISNQFTPIKNGHFLSSLFYLLESLFSRRHLFDCKNLDDFFIAVFAERRKHKFLSVCRFLLKFAGCGGEKFLVHGTLIMKNPQKFHLKY